MLKVKLYTVVFLAVVLSFFSCEKTGSKPFNTKLNGLVFGTSYAIIYQSQTDYSKAVDSIFEVINHSMSTYRSNSIITLVNRNEAVKLDRHFISVFNMAKEVYEKTDGIFDPTIGILVNAWNFGPEGAIDSLDSTKIKSLKNAVGFNLLHIDNDTLIKQNPNTYIDFNAIAKGYAIDVLAGFLDAQGVADYLIEIGGEVRIKGCNIEKKSPWRIGIDRPNFNGESSVFKSFDFIEGAMATSGTYRKFKVDAAGNRFAHIINPKTGYPASTPILSVSVIAPSCSVADAYATAFQAMSLQAIETFLQTNPHLKVFVIYEAATNELKTLSFNGFPVD